MECIDVNETICTSGRVSEKTGVSPECAEGQEFCSMFRVCGPPDSCTPQTLIEWRRRGNRSVDLFGEACPTGTQFSDLRMKCLNESQMAIKQNQTKCEDGLRFCAAQHSCLPLDVGCGKVENASAARVAQAVKDSGVCLSYLLVATSWNYFLLADLVGLDILITSVHNFRSLGWPMFCQIRRTICARVEHSLGNCRQSDLSKEACSSPELPRCPGNLHYCPRTKEYVQCFLYSYNPGQDCVGHSCRMQCLDHRSFFTWNTNVLRAKFYPLPFPMQCCS